ncbi:MAG: hypothetical protein R2706_11405 [Acidimicrobiales bacterium]
MQRAVAEAKASLKAGRRRVYRPWIVERDVGAVGLGPRTDNRGSANESCGVRGWRGAAIRVVIPTWDRTLPTVIGCLDASMRAWEEPRRIG